jgi:hypothetical protein
MVRNRHFRGCLDIALDLVKSVWMANMVQFNIELFVLVFNFKTGGEERCEVKGKKKNIK